MKRLIFFMMLVGALHANAQQWSPITNGHIWNLNSGNVGIGIPNPLYKLDVLKCLVDGDSYKMIADHCSISIDTVCGHINSIYRKLAVNSKSEAVIKAIKERLV